MIPGSERLVLNKEDMVNMNNKPPIIGIATVTFSAKYLQLQIKYLLKIKAQLANKLLIDKKQGACPCNQENCKQKHAPMGGCH